MSIRITNGIQLPAFDVESLIVGRLIAVPFRHHVKEGQGFWLCPSQILPDSLSPEQYYQDEYVLDAKQSLINHETHPIQIRSWGRCERQWRINPDQKHVLPTIAQSTVWKLDALEYIFEKFQVLKLLFLRVYRLSSPLIVNAWPESGAFYWPDPKDVIPPENLSDTPAVSEASFGRRKAFLLAGKTSPHRELEELQLQIEKISADNPAAQYLDHDIKQFLGWISNTQVQTDDAELIWINTIAELGNRSKEQDEEKSNYQAGTDFENIVRRSLEFLGFTVDYFHKGGAGGIDIFCSKPYSLVGECKSGKKIPNDTAVQLLNLGTLRLRDRKLINQSAKLIIGPGEPTEQLEDAAKVHGMAIISPKTLENLVRIQSKYRNSVDLIKLKEHLKPGYSDDEVEKYIEHIRRDIVLRSQIVRSVRELSEQNSDNLETAHQYLTVIEVRTHYNATRSPRLDDGPVHNLLVELSSPLTGYLGRIKGNDWQNDRFYFLRDLPE